MKPRVTDLGDYNGEVFGAYNRSRESSISLFWNFARKFEGK